ncbi:MAG: hypothetical protein DCC49_13555 [Acidobacteria bacterium]|nr:MAG: hypothetical protein DCC49_13555 [Acidobacteriota bacterium]
MSDDYRGRVDDNLSSRLKRLLGWFETPAAGIGLIVIYGTMSASAWLYLSWERIGGGSWLIAVWAALLFGHAIRTAYIEGRRESRVRHVGRASPSSERNPRRLEE